MRAHDGKFFFRFLCFNTVHSHLHPGQLAGIFHVKQIGIAKELQKREIIFWNDVSVAVVVVVVVVVAKASYHLWITCVGVGWIFK